MGSEENVYIASPELIQEIYDYLNSRPRVEVNRICMALESLPVIPKPQPQQKMEVVE